MNAAGCVLSTALGKSLLNLHNTGDMWCTYMMFFLTMSNFLLGKSQWRVHHLFVSYNMNTEDSWYTNSHLANFVYTIMNKYNDTIVKTKKEKETTVSINKFHTIRFIFEAHLSPWWSTMNGSYVYQLSKW